MLMDPHQLPEQRDLPDRRLHARREHLLSETSRRAERRSLFRRPLVRGTAVAVGLAVVVLGVLSLVNVFGSNGPSIVGKAQAALEVPANLVLHFKTAGTQDNGDGTSVSWADETWQLGSSQQSWRRIETSSDVAPAETAHTGQGYSQVYDPATNTIYQASESVSQTDSPDTFKAEAMNLLNSGSAKVDGHVAVDGRDAMRIVSADGSLTYIVDAKTGEPIEWQTKGAGGGVTMRLTFEKLPALSDNLKLVDLVSQHPGAALDSDPQHYRDAVARAFPKG